MACSANKNTKSISQMPECLLEKIKSMAANPKEGAPQSVISYIYKNQTVYYVVSPCCDKYNVVYDKDCKVLGYPDGGYTGRGDGKMSDFKDEASQPKIVWEKK
jgi:hypothetical protein